MQKLLPLALLLASWQLSASALAQTAIISGSGSCRTSSSTPTKSREHAKAIPLANSFGVDVEGIACMTSQNQGKRPAPDGGNSPNSPDSTSDIDDSDGGLDDFSADPSTRNYQDTSHFSLTGLDAVTLRTPRIIPILLFPVHCFYCLHEHIRERAPPIPV